MSLENPIKAVEGGRIDLAPRLPRSSMGALNRQYLAERNAALALKRRSAEIDLAIREGALLPIGPLKIQLSPLIAAAREEVRAWHIRLAPLLVGQDLHTIRQILREAEGDLLNILAELPAALGNGDQQLTESEKREDATSPLAPPPSLNETKRAEKKRIQAERWNAIRRERRAAAKRGEG